MPIYEYQCGSCMKTIEIIQKFSDSPPSQCEQCQERGHMTKLMSQTSFLLKGGGWYDDAYSSKTAKKTTDKDDKPTTTDSPGDGKTADPKPESKKAVDKPTVSSKDIKPSKAKTPAKND